MHRPALDPTQQATASSYAPTCPALVSHSISLVTLDSSSHDASWYESHTLAMILARPKSPNCRITCLPCHSTIQQATAYYTVLPLVPTHKAIAYCIVLPLLYPTRPLHTALPCPCPGPQGHCILNCPAPVPSHQATAYCIVLPLAQPTRPLHTAVYLPLSLPTWPLHTAFSCP